MWVRPTTTQMPWDPGLLQYQHTEGEACKRTRDVYPWPGADLAPNPWRSCSEAAKGPEGQVTVEALAEQVP